MITGSQRNQALMVISTESFIKRIEGWIKQMCTNRTPALNLPVLMTSAAQSTRSLKWLTRSELRFTTELLLMDQCLSLKWVVKANTTKLDLSRIVIANYKMISSLHLRKTRPCSRKPMVTCRDRIRIMTLPRVLWVGMISKECLAASETKPIMCKTMFWRAVKLIQPRVPSQVISMASSINLCRKMYLQVTNSHIRLFPM